MEVQSNAPQGDDDRLSEVSYNGQVRPALSFGTASPHQHGSHTPLGERLIDSSRNTPRRQTPIARIARTPAPDGTGRLFHPDASLVLVGIRASGKRSLGLIAATALGRRFVTEDHYFQTVNGLSRQDYLKVHGSEEFHRQDVETSKRMLEDNKYRCVIDCGLGSLTSGVQTSLRQYSQTNPVVFVLRDSDRIKSLLGLDDRSAKLLDNGNATHRKCSNFEFYNLEDESATVMAESDTLDRASPNYSFKLRNAQADFSTFVRFITGTHSIDPNQLSPFSLAGPVEVRAYTHALFLKLSDFVDGRVNLSSLESAGDVLEILVDQWKSTSAGLLSKMVAQARRFLNVPILLSASRNHSASSAETYIAILLHGLRLGVEYLSVDLDMKNADFRRLQSNKGYTKLIGNYLNAVQGGAGWRDEIWDNMYERAVTLKCEMVRLLNSPASREDNDAVSWFAQQLRQRSGPQPVAITYNVGSLGRTSQVMNSVLTSVSHPEITEDPDQKDRTRPLLSSRDVVRTLFDSYVFDPLKFYIVGANVSQSLSPAMHNAAYECLGLKHHCSTRNITSFTDIEDLAKDNALGGLSIVQPYKVRLVPHMHSLSGHAKAIGAVNTLIPIRAYADGTVPPLHIQARERNRAGRIVGWFGDNTDFVGMMSCINRSLSPRNAIQPKTTGLVIGAGGMARAAVYAMLQIGCKNIFVYNRTLANTEALALHFNTWARDQTSGHFSASSQDPIKVLKSTNNPWPTSFSLPTVVISCVTHEVLDGNPGADFELPDAWMQSPTGGVVVEMAYMTKETPLIRQVKQFRQSTQRPWVLVNGIEALIEQAIGQFESSTGRKAPKRRMAEAVYTAITHDSSYVVDGEDIVN